MPLSAAARSLELLFGLSFLLQTLEHLRMDRAMAPGGLWPWHLQRRDVPNRYVRALLDQVFAPQVLHAQLLLRVVAVVVLVVQGSSLALVLFLFISQVLMLLRWRGAFNGGSDFMTLIVLTGMLIAQCMAQAGDPEAQYNLATLYRGGKGVERNLELAFSWTCMAAEQGIALAQTRLGVAYGSGEGVAADPIEAHKWLLIAESGGDVLARANLEYSRSLLNLLQIKEASRRADKWRKDWDKNLIMQKRQANQAFFASQ